MLVVLLVSYSSSSPLEHSFLFQSSVLLQLGGTTGHGVRSGSGKGSWLDEGGVSDSVGRVLSHVKEFHPKNCG